MPELQRRRLVQQAPPQVQPRSVQAQKTSDFVLRNRSKRRSAELLDAISRVDTLQDPAVQRQLADWINSVYEQRGGGALVGLFGHCYLGHPYVDHEMDLAGHILRHFRPEDPISPPFLAARAFARSTAYLFIEVYDDGMVVPVRADGSSAI